MKNKITLPKTDPTTYRVNPKLKSLANDPFITQQAEKIMTILNKSKDAVLS